MPRASASTATRATAAPKLAVQQRTNKPERLLFYAVEGWGKTTMAAHIPGVAMVMASGETGYETLLNNGRVPAIPAVTVHSWQELMAFCDEQLSEEPLGYQHLAFDAAGRFERMCHEYVCDREFKGEWGEKGFSAFQRGYHIAIAEWLKFQERLERLNNRGIGITILGHVTVKSFKNPAGADFDRYSIDVHPNTTGAELYRWADNVFFGNFVTIVDDVNAKSKKGKGIGGNERVIYTQRCDAFDAKNKHGMPECISISDDYKQNWNTLQHYMTNGNGGQ